MNTQENGLIPLFVVGMGLVVVGLLPLEAAAWQIQYAVLGLGLLTLGGAAYRTTSSAAG